MMIRRQLLRQLRISSQPTPTSISTSIQNRSISSALHIPSRAPILSASRIPRRWQTTAAAQAADSSPTLEATPAESSLPAESPLQQEVEKQKKEIIELKDKYLRSVADYRNLQERMRREQESARQFGIQRFASDLLDSIDNLDRALTAVPNDALTPSDTNKELINLHGGLKMTEQIMQSALTKHGLEKFDPMEREGAKFDPNLDEATFFSKQEGKDDGEVFFTQSKGFKLNGRVIRAAKVGVVKNN